MHARLDIWTTQRRSHLAGMNGTAFASLVVAGVTLAWAVHRDLAHRRALAVRRPASAREADERKAAETREEQRHREGIANSRPVRGAEERRMNRARLVGVCTGASSGSRDGVDFPLSVQNDGGESARDVRLWLAFDEAGVAPKDAQPLSHTQGFDVVLPGQSPSPFKLTQAGPFYGARMEREGAIMASWKDESGDHVDKIGRLTLFQ